MSTLKATNLSHPSAASPNVVMGSTGSVAVAGALTGAGMDLINTTSFSAVSSVSVNNCFTSTYENYRIVVTGTGSSSGINIFMRVRSSGTDLAANYYMANSGIDFNGSSANSNYANSSEGFYVGKVNTDARGASTIDIFRPYLSTNTTCTGLAYSASTADAINAFMGLANTTSAYDGFTLRTSSGTFTGTVRVYGYRNS